MHRRCPTRLRRWLPPPGCTDVTCPAGSRATRTARASAAPALPVATRIDTVAAGILARAVDFRVSGVIRNLPAGTRTEEQRIGHDDRDFAAAIYKKRPRDERPTHSHGKTTIEPTDRAQHGRCIVKRNA